jgi:uncharacterized cupredoxin-like copper-binding protein
MPKITFDSNAALRASCTVLLRLAVLALTACAAEGADIAEAESPPSGTHVLTVTATDDRFDAAGEIAPGLTTIHMINGGRELHQVQIFRIPADRTSAEFVASVMHPGPLPAWAIAVGGPNAVVPGGTSDATLELTPGRYIVACLVPDADHVPHAAKGMVRPLTVLSARFASRQTPWSDRTVTLTEYAFVLSEPLTVGSHTLRVENDGTQDHEAVLVRLAPGKTARDFAAWADDQIGPPPGEPIGGVTALAPGLEAYVTIDFTPGRYALLCFLPDARDGRPHVAYGMIKEFAIP